MKLLPRHPWRPAVWLGLSLGMGLPSAGCPTPRARELASLRADVDTLTKQSDELQRQLAAWQNALQADLEARAVAVQSEITRLDEALMAQRVLLAEQTDAGEVQDIPRTEPHEAHRSRRPHKQGKPDPAPEPQDDNIDDPAERVAALMADVAARLQVASETAPKDAQSKLVLNKARQKLVDANRAAAQKDYPRAEELALDAAEGIAKIAPDAGAPPTSATTEP